MCVRRTGEEEEDEEEDADTELKTKTHTSMWGNIPINVGKTRIKISPNRQK